jgi:hypothetical protein
VWCSFLLPNDLRECTRATASVISFSTVARWITQHSEAEGARQAGTRKPPRKSTSRCTCSPPQSALAADGGGTEAHERGGPRTGCAHRMRCRGPRRSQRANRPRGPASRAERPAFGPAARAAPGAPPPPMPQRRTFGSRRTPAKWGGLRNSEAHLLSAEADARHFLRPVLEHARLATLWAEPQPHLADRAGTLRHGDRAAKTDRSRAATAFLSIDGQRAPSGARGPAHPP